MYFQVITLHMHFINLTTGTRNHGSSKHGSGVEVVSIVDIDMDSPVVCGMC